MKFIKYEGQRFGKLLVLSRNWDKPAGVAFWNCKCDCGATYCIRAGNLKRAKACITCAHQKDRHLTNLQRLERKVIKSKNENQCWGWDGNFNLKGYAQLLIDEGGPILKLRRGGRVSYSEYVETIPEGMHVLHTCDNPACCNPNHLFLGTNADNIRDKVLKGRQSRMFGSKNPMWKQK